MNKTEAANQLLNKVCEKDIVVRNIMKDLAIKTNVINILENGFEYIVIEYPDLIEDIQRRIIEYHTCNDPDKIRKITDFAHLPQWYSWSLKDKPKEWWDISGKYYGLKMNEVINMYLICESMSIKNNK